MPINYFWWCSHWASSFLGYISPESKKKPHVFFPIMPAKEEKLFCDLGSSSSESPAPKKRYSTYLEKNNQNLRETSSEHGFLHLALVVLFEDVPLLGRHKKAAGENLENIPCSPSVAALRPDVHFSGVLGIQPWPTSPPRFLWSNFER